jgi:DNA-binding XRE family transcriptional regulator
MPNTQITMNGRTIMYIRKQLRFQHSDLDGALKLEPGTIAAAENGEITLEPTVILRLRHLIKSAEMAGMVPERRHIGMMIRQARVGMGMTQQYVCDRAGLGQQHLSNIEREANPKISTILRIAAAMEIPVEWILRGEVLTDDLDLSIIPKSADKTTSPSETKAQ